MSNIQVKNHSWELVVGCWELGVETPSMIQEIGIILVDINDIKPIHVYCIFSVFVLIQ